MEKLNIVVDALDRLAQDLAVQEHPMLAPGVAVSKSIVAKGPVAKIYEVRERLITHTPKHGETWPLLDEVVKAVDAYEWPVRPASERATDLFNIGLTPVDRVEKSDQHADLLAKLEGWRDEEIRRLRKEYPTMLGGEIEQRALAKRYGDYTLYDLFQLVRGPSADREKAERAEKDLELGKLVSRVLKNLGPEQAHALAEGILKDEAKVTPLVRRLMASLGLSKERAIRYAELLENAGIAADLALPAGDEHDASVGPVRQKPSQADLPQYGPVTPKGIRPEL